MEFLELEWLNSIKKLDRQPQNAIFLTVLLAKDYRVWSRRNFSVNLDFQAHFEPPHEFWLKMDLRCGPTFVETTSIESFDIFA